MFLRNFLAVLQPTSSIPSTLIIVQHKRLQLWMRYCSKGGLGISCWFYCDAIVSCSLCFSYVIWWIITHMTMKLLFIWEQPDMTKQNVCNFPFHFVLLFGISIHVVVDEIPFNQEQDKWVFSKSDSRFCNVMLYRFEKSQRNHIGC